MNLFSLGKQDGLPEVRVGYIPLTDCATIAVAHELGFDRKHGIVIRPILQPSWAALRDKLIGGELEAAHCLYGLVYDIELGLIGPKRDMAVLMHLNRNGQAITLSQSLIEAGVRDGSDLARLVLSRPALTFAHTFPTGTHAMWFNFWLAAHGINPIEDIQMLTVPPPQMVARLQSERIQGFCAGEPWSALAVSEGLGYTVATSQSIWSDHPEKVLASARSFADDSPDLAVALIQAVLEASRYADQPEHHDEISRLLASCGYVDAAAGQILPRLQGCYFDGLGRRWQDAHPLSFHADGESNYPYLSDAVWFLTQHYRWGMLNERPDWYGVARRVTRTDLYQAAANALSVPLPSTGDRRSSMLSDGRAWTGHDPDTYADGFGIHARKLKPHSRASL